MQIQYFCGASFMHFDMNIQKPDVTFFFIPVFFSHTDSCLSQKEFIASGTEVSSQKILCRNFLQSIFHYNI